jgi:hypothetical protein
MSANTDDLIEALGAMQQAMVEFENERTCYELRTGKEPEVEVVMQALITAGVALIEQRDLLRAPEFDHAMMFATNVTWHAEAALRRASASLAAYRAE